MEALECGDRKETEVTFDELGRLRLLPQELADASESLRTDCSEFIGASRALLTLVDRVASDTSRRAAEVESAKLRAIAARTGLERESLRRHAELNRLSFALRERQLELERLSAELESLQRVEHDQEAIISALRSR